MDFLKAEIARKKRLLEKSDVIGESSGKKFFKRGDLMEKEAEDYMKRHRKDSEKDTEDRLKPGRSNSTSDDAQQDPSINILSRQEVIKRLRERSEPIQLFGESESEAFFRLRRIEMMAPEINKGYRNDFKDAMDKVDQAYLDEMVRTQGEDVPSSAYDIKCSDEGLTEQALIEMSLGLRKGDDELDFRVTLSFIKFLLKVWADDLNARPEFVKKSTRGKLQAATYSQTQAYIRPLMRKLKKKSLPPDLLDSLAVIVRFMLQREYVKASDAYLQMAIGNAPWPIGVTMVGIHARTGREKIFSKNVAHVLNDETQRKFIQALKRLMTLMQRHFPTDPSKCVEYNA